MGPGSEQASSCWNSVRPDLFEVSDRHATSSVATGWPAVAVQATCSASGRPVFSKQQVLAALSSRRQASSKKGARASGCIVVVRLPPTAS